MTTRRPVRRADSRELGARALRVLVVDDSAVVRETMRLLLERAGGMLVTSASDPVIAEEKIRRERPDVIVLDLEMPRMDGLTFLRRLMSTTPIPVVVCSGLARSGTAVALQALEEGAVDVVSKPDLDVRGFLSRSASLLADTVRGAALARVVARRYAPIPAGGGKVVGLKGSIERTTDKVVVIGASTGGTEALRRVLEDTPPDSPGMVIVQHMPAGFTSAFAQRLNEICQIEVKEAEDGDRVMAGRALIAPGGRHVMVCRTGAKYVVGVHDGPLVSGHRPSVDVLFQSAASAVGPNAIGVIMTGMGGDGAEGLLAMRQAGASTIAQDEQSCVVFGMSREAIARGAVDDIVPLERLAAVIGSRARAARVVG